MDCKIRLDEDTENAEEIVILDDVLNEPAVKECNISELGTTWNKNDDNGRA